MIEDVRYAVRQLRKAPAFAAAAIVTLALGIGAAAAMFGLIQGVLLSPPPYAAPDRLVLVSPRKIDGSPYTQGTWFAQWIQWKSESRTLEPPALYRWTFNFLVLPDGSQSLGGMVVTRNFFSTLGVRPLHGREFTEAEASRPKVPATGIMLGYELWQRQFKGDPAVVGTAIRISRYPAPLTVVGVMPPGIRFLPDPANAAEPNYDVDAPVDFWVSFTPDETRSTPNGVDDLEAVRAALSRARGTGPQRDGVVRAVFRVARCRPVSPPRHRLAALSFRAALRQPGPDRAPRLPGSRPLSRGGTRQQSACSLARTRRAGRARQSRGRNAEVQRLASAGRPYRYRADADLSGSHQRRDFGLEQGSERRAVRHPVRVRQHAAEQVGEHLWREGRRRGGGHQ